MYKELRLADDLEDAASAIRRQGLKLRHVNLLREILAELEEIITPVRRE